MKRLFSKVDWLLLAAALICAAFGLLLISSVAPNLFGHQLILLVVGLFLFVLFSQIDFEVYESLAPLFYGVSILLLLATLFFGRTSRGATRWLSVAGIDLQASELVRPLLLVFFAERLSQVKEWRWGRFWLHLLFLLVPVGLIFRQPDLGTSLLFLAAWLALIIAAGVSWRWLLGGLLSLAVIIPLVWRFLAPYQQDRVLTFLDPNRDPLGSGFTTIQSMVAVGAGRWLGRGLGWGTQSHLRFLPERHTDFIFASLGEELGFLGALLLLAAFLVLLWRLLLIALAARERAGFLFGIGFFGLLLSQILVNVGMNIGLMPITGVTLPLVSYGGNSLLATMISLGMMSNLARQGKKREVIEIR